MKDLAKRLQQIPPYLFAGIEKKIAQARKEGKDIISLGIGDPDMPTPDYIIDELIRTVKDPVNHQYPSSQGMLSYRKAVSDFYARRFGVEDLDPETEVCALIGSKEGIANINYCFTDAGDINLIPDPAYPVYSTATMMAGGLCYPMRLTEENGFLPDFDTIPNGIADRAKLMWLNYPNNPTGAVASKEQLQAIADVVIKHDLFVLSDEIYSELTYTGENHVSIASLPGMRDRTIVVNGFSKAFAMTGWRLGYVSGPANIVTQMLKIHQFAIMCAPTNSQYAGIEAMRNGDEDILYMRAEYDIRRKYLLERFRELGIPCYEAKGAFYLFPCIEKFGMTSSEFCEKLLEEQKLAVVPGSAFGASGEGFVRISYAYSLKNLKKAMARIEAFAEAHGVN